MESGFSFASASFASASRLFLTSSSLASFSLASCASFASLALASSSIMALPSIAPGMAPMGIVGTIGMAPKPIMPGSWAISGFAMGIADIGICGACRACACGASGPTGSAGVELTHASGAFTGRAFVMG